MPRNPARIPHVLAAVAKFWEQHPDLRLGQLVFAVSKNIDPFYVEDDVIIRRIEELINAS